MADSNARAHGLPAYRVVRSTRRKRTVAIRVERDGGVVVLAPARLPASEIAAFVRERGPWLAAQRARMDALPRVAPAGHGPSIPFRGAEVPLAIVADGRAAQAAWGEGGVVVTVPAGLAGEAREAAVAAAVGRWYREQAMAAAEESVRRFSPAPLPCPTRLLIRDQRTRWGSCAADGTVRLNWRVVLLPPELCDYVVVHELAHLVHGDHGPAFWATVAAVLPDHRDRRRRIRETDWLAWGR